MLSVSPRCPKFGLAQLGHIGVSPQICMIGGRWGMRREVGDDDAPRGGGCAERWGMGREVGMGRVVGWLQARGRWAGYRARAVARSALMAAR